MKTLLKVPWAVLALTSMARVSQAATASYSQVGCYKEADLESALSSKGSYIYQSVSYCEEQCDGSEVAALLGGNTCYCGDASALGGASSGDSSNCNTKCAGWPYDTCGGSGYMQVYVREGVSVPSASASSSASSSSASSTSSSTSTSTSSSSSSSTKSSTSSSSQSSTTSSSTTRSSSTSASSSSSSSSTSSSASSTSSSDTSSSTSAATSSASSSSSPSSSSQPSSSSPASSSTSSSATPSSTSSTVSATNSPSVSATSVTLSRTTMVTASVSVVTLSNNNRSTMYVTATTIVEAPSSSAQANASTKNNSNGKSKKSLSGGAIAGVVIGAIVGSFLIAATVFFLFWRRRNRREADLEETKQHQPYSFGGTGAVPLAGATRRNTSLNASSSSNDAQFTDEYLQASPTFEDSFGRIRLSNGSLPDVTQEHGPLRIVNPDSD
ncbi:Wsc2p [Lachancea thermotolerans CBS 6340]|uniref:KLTH0C09196p n=1 Tax=Lachancea thermotolerans (strain ATCC 56472 / CBS 6340 / NRRL Y-8284) TaxID=559295 RepID=C5DEH2_LACTC|nr:KLTH0C09196p [Lachancea thermotolerans CBS 6340]CAR22183.1 KLTH0C09196p [Lachancea thermotolerans CBS 6340]